MYMASLRSHGRARSSFLEQGHMLIHSVSQGRHARLRLCLNFAANVVFVQYTCLSVHALLMQSFRSSLTFTLKSCVCTHRSHRERTDEEGGDFYAHLTAVLGSLPNPVRHNLIAMGAFIAQVCLDQ